tara:strand:- start:24192 stop:24338 length:147 start_codon:yes stop_codon:yes gene_type:complete
VGINGYIWKMRFIPNETGVILQKAVKQCLNVLWKNLEKVFTVADILTD